MTPEPTESTPAPCPRCNEPMTLTTVRTAIWRGEALAIVEDIPAHVCSACVEQYYDEAVSDALRRLAESGFPVAEAAREITVPVFSLNGRIRERVPLPEDTFID